MKPIRQFAEDTTLYPSPKEIEKAKHAVDAILRHADSVQFPSFIPESSRRLALSDGSVMEITIDNANKWINIATILRVFLDRLHPCSNHGTDSGYTQAPVPVTNLRLIGQSKLPERDDVAIACFDVIFDNVALGRILYLLLLFLFAPHLKGFSVYFEVAHT